MVVVVFVCLKVVLFFESPPVVANIIKVNFQWKANAKPLASRHDYRGSVTKAPADSPAQGQRCIIILEISTLKFRR